MEYVSDLTAPGVDDRMCRAGNVSIGHQVVQYQRNLESAHFRQPCPIQNTTSTGGDGTRRTCDGSDIRHARPTNTLLRSTIGSASISLIPSGSATFWRVGAGCDALPNSSESTSSFVDCTDSCGAESRPEASSRISSPTRSLLSLSSYHTSHSSRTL